MMPGSLPMAASLTAALLLTTAPVSATEEVVSKSCNACTFWPEYDTKDCKVYGELHTGGLIAYDRASETCLDYYNVQVESITLETLKPIFPTPDGEGGNVELLIDLLRDEADATSGAVYDLKRYSLPRFFREPPGTEDQPLIFVETIQLGITRFDCTNNNGNDCWPALREYLSQPGSAGELSILGRRLWHAVQHEKEVEQQTVRMSICQDKVPSQTVCGNLVTQIENQWRGMTTGIDNCDLFGLGPGPHKGQLGGECRLDQGGGWYPLHPTPATSAAAVTRRSSLVTGGRMMMMMMVTGAMITWLGVVV
mmetsp:Transcript_7590/g.16772  ORF Transcript_7590/g.16772 Transcript_7590/m.16772 type:complete len:309 (+) Transcript_7590:3-929(+)